jgi:hypothetical protein
LFPVNFLRPVFRDCWQLLIAAPLHHHFLWNCQVGNSPLVRFPEAMPSSFHPSHSEQLILAGYHDRS